MIPKLALRAFKPFFIFYYRFLFGRSFPASEKVAKWVLAWERGSGRRNVPISQEDWEKEYREGDWDFLRGLDELARYSVIAGFLHRLRPGGSILDVGCGEAVLLEELLPYGASRYVGLDVSEVAIERCAARNFENASFVAAAAESYEPEERFDVIVFNECLYYFNDPVGVVESYRRALNDGGLLVVSQFKSRRASAIARGLKEKLPLIDETLVTNRKGTWILDVFGAKDVT